MLVRIPLFTPYTTTNQVGCYHLMMKGLAMLRKMPGSLISALLLLILSIASPVAAQDKGASCFTAEARAQAERTAKVWQEPDPGYDPVLGFNPTKGARTGALPVDSNG